MYAAAYMTFLHACLEHQSFMWLPKSSNLCCTAYLQQGKMYGMLPQTMKCVLQIAELDICLTTLDNPDAISPKLHIWCESQRPWLKLTDILPRKPRESSSA